MKKETNNMLEEVEIKEFVKQVRKLGQQTLETLIKRTFYLTFICLKLDISIMAKVRQTS